MWKAHITAYQNDDDDLTVFLSCSCAQEQRNEENMEYKKADTGTQRLDFLVIVGDSAQRV